MDELSLNYDKIALVLPGGGAKGGYQLGALKTLKEQNPRIKFEVISGVSVGALNAAMLATRSFDALWDIWNEIKEKDVLEKRSWASIGWHLLSWKIGFNKPLKGIYSNKPLLKTIKDNVGRHTTSNLVIGNVNITKNRYEKQEYFKGQAIANHEQFYHNILASASIPGIWPPTQINGDQYVDGGVRNLAPLGDVLSYDPDLVITIPANRYPPKNYASDTDGNIIDVMARTMDNMTSEIFRNDLEKFLMLNSMVGYAQEKGIQLKKDSGGPYKYYESLIISPSQGLGNPLDFSRNSIDQRILQGQKDAKEVLKQFANK